MATGTCHPSSGKHQATYCTEHTLCRRFWKEEKELKVRQGLELAEDHAGVRVCSCWVVPAASTAVRKNSARYVHDFWGEEGVLFTSSSSLELELQ